MTKNEVEKFGSAFAQYIMGELESYNLKFNFGAPIIRLTKLPFEVSLQLELWGSVLPEDVSRSDEEVLTKFLEHMFNEFVVSYDIDYKYCEYACYIYDDDGTTIFDVHIYGIKTEE